MALQGTLDTFALPDVLRLLAVTRKTGRLDVRNDDRSGSAWFDSGLVVAADVAGSGNRDLTESTFELLRFDTGTFSFDSGAVADAPGAGVPVEEVLSGAEAMLGEWSAVEAIVPTMDAWVTLRPELPDDEIILSRETWSTIVAIGSGSTVRRLATAVEAGDLAACRAVVELTDLGLADVAAEGPVTDEEPQNGPAEEDPGAPTGALTQQETESPGEEEPVGVVADGWPLPVDDDIIRFAEPVAGDAEGGEGADDTAGAADDPDAVAVEDASWTPALETPVADSLAQWFSQQPAALAAAHEEAAAQERALAGDADAAVVPAWFPPEAGEAEVPWLPQDAGEDVFAGWVADSEVPDDADAGWTPPAEATGTDGDQDRPEAAGDDDRTASDRNALRKFLSSLKH